MEEASRPAPFQELLATELRLDPRQWEEAPKRRREQRDVTKTSPPPRPLLEIDCLVHQDWMEGASCGLLPPPHAPPVPTEDMHWLLQPSCDCHAPKHWQRVSILCIRKTPEPDTQTRAAKRFFIQQEGGYSKESIHELLTQISQENLLVSWQEMLMSKHPSPSTGPRLATPAYVREVIHKLYHTEVCPLQRGKKRAGPESHTSSTSPSRNQGNVPAHKSLTSSSVATVAKEQVHSNLSPLLAALESRKAFYLVFPYDRFTLFDIALHSPAMFNDSVAKPLFVLFQLLKVLEHCHKVGVTLGLLNMCNVFVDSRLWVQVRVPTEEMCPVRAGSLKAPECKDGGLGREGESRGWDSMRKDREKKKGKEREKMRLRREKQLGLDGKQSASASTLAASETESEGESTESAKDTSTESSPVKKLQQTPGNGLVPSVPEPPVIPLSEAVKKWQHGNLDNFTYIMLLNRHAGRRMGDPNDHPIFPWVSDFTHPSRSFRDLTKSKHRLNKGDEQLNYTYSNAREDMRRGFEQEGSIPHHVGDIMTDVTYYVYKARRTPRDVLCGHVRPRWVPEEYPASIEKMYVWTPDESIPEFYTDSLIFKSIHTDLPDLALPAWCPSPEAFISFHRHLLEGDYVSSQLHHWIDLTFGYKLSGEAAVRAKNVYLSLVDKHKNPMNHGIVQLFRTAHPKRVQSSPAPVALLEWESYLGQSSVSDGASFPIHQHEVVTHESLSNEQTGSNGARVSLRTLDSIVEQQTQKLQGGEGKRVDGMSYPTQQEQSDDSSFEQIAIPDESYASTPSSYPNSTVGISYGDSTLDGKLPTTQVKNASKQKEGAVLNVVQTQPTIQQNRFRVAKYFRPRKHNQSEGSNDEYPWQNMEISLPRECNALHALLEQEERAHFVARCCKDFADTLGPSWEQKDIEEASSAPIPEPPPLLELLQRQQSDTLFCPSLADRVMIDVASATVTVIEMCCMRELRVATSSNASLLERVTVIRTLLSAGQLRLPSYLQNLAEVVLLPVVKRTLSDHFALPRLSPSLLLQPFVPVVPFPPYFEQVYAFASALELLCRDAGLKKYHESKQLAIKPLSPPSPLHNNLKVGILDKIMTLVTENLQLLVRAAQGEGFVLLLLHLYPLFQFPETSFEMIQMHLDTLGTFMSHVQMYRLFMSVILHFFDSPLEPHQQGFLFSRSTTDFLIRRFGLHTFLGKFLEFFLEAVLEPNRLSTKGTSTHKNIRCLKESESVLTLLQSTELGHSLNYDEQKQQSRVSDFTFSVDLSGGYNSDQEYSSGESENEFVPESSLLARTGMMLGMSMGGIEEQEEEGEERESRGEEEGRGSVQKHSRFMILPQLSSGGRETPDSAQLEQQTLHTDKIKELAAAGADSGAEVNKELDSLQNTLKVDTTSSEFKPLLDSPTDSTNVNGLVGLEDSIPSQNSISHDSLLSKTTPLQQHGRLSETVSSIHHAAQTNIFPASVEREGKQRESGGEGERGEDEEDLAEKMIETSGNDDPEVAAINQQIAGVAGDSLCWLMRRLGPLLATHHIVSPLLNGMHHCFTGTINHHGRESEVLRCLQSMAELYGDGILLKLYLPRVEGWVASATNRMTVKTESSLAGALALTRLITQQLPLEQLEEVTHELCENFFIPLIQLLSSQTVFPSGGKARATVCHSLVLILLKTGKKLGREKSSELLLETLRLFFTCFDGVYSSGATEPRSRSRGHTESSISASSHYSMQASAPGELQGWERERSSTTYPTTVEGVLQQSPNLGCPKKTVSLDGESEGAIRETSRGDLKAIQVTSHPLAASPGNTGAAQLSTPDQALEQLQETFTPAMAHATYIPFCKLLGQIKLNMELRNTELIEQIAYSYDENVQQKNCLPSVFPGSEDELLSSLSSESEDSSTEDQTEDDMARDVMIKLGPVVAVQRRRGLDEDAVNFGRSSWFVNLQDGGDSSTNMSSQSGVTSGVEWGANESLSATGVRGGVGVPSGVPSGIVGSAEVTRSVVTTEEGGVKGWMEGVRGSAMATASGILQLIQSRPVAETQQGSTTKADYLTRQSINFDMKFQTSPGPDQPGLDSNSEDVDCRLGGQWRELWESQLQQPPQSQELYTHFAGRKLQTYAGHKGSVRSLAVSDTENFFLSASKDRTVKLWLLRNQGTGSVHLSPHLTYSQHQKAVSHVELISATGNAVSCDGTVHLWDSESGYFIHQFSSPRGREFVAMTCLLPPQSVAVVATNDVALRFIDFRAHTLQHMWKLHFTTGGILRHIACGDNWVAVGNNSGTITTLDLRMGELLHQWKPSDFSVVQTTTWNENLFQLRATRRGNLVTSMGPGTVHLWRPSTGKLLSHIRGQSSTTPCLDCMGEQLVSASSNGHVVIHNCFERTKDTSSTLFWSTKARSKELKGGVSSMATVQEKRLLLLGSDNGHIVLMS